MQVKKNLPYYLLIRLYKGKACYMSDNTTKDRYPLSLKPTLQHISDTTNKASSYIL